MQELYYLTTDGIPFCLHIKYNVTGMNGDGICINYTVRWQLLGHSKTDKKASEHDSPHLIQYRVADLWLGL